MKIIGLTGPAGSGKSTIAGIMYRNHGFVEMAFAAPIRDMVQRFSGYDGEALAEKKEEPCDALCGRSPRYAMQTLGTEWGRRMIGEDLWIRLLEADLAHFGDADTHAVISDVRFPNEAAWIRERGELWHLTRPGHAVNAHISEAGIPITDRDVELDNDCDLDELARRIAETLNGFAR